MTKNMGIADRIIRITVALGIAALYYFGWISGTLGIILLVFAGIFLLTSMIGFCPLYSPFGLNTCSRSKE